MITSANYNKYPHLPKPHCHVAPQATSKGAWKRLLANEELQAWSYKMHMAKAKQRAAKEKATLISDAQQAIKKIVSSGCAKGVWSQHRQELTAQELHRPHCCHG